MKTIKKVTLRNLIDKETGEEIQINEVIQYEQRDNFEIAYISTLCGIMNRLGGQKYKILSYLIKNKNSDNQIIATNRELALKLNVSTKTLTETLKILRDYGVITTRTGAIMILPKLAMQGNAYKEQKLMITFREFQTNEQLQKEKEKRQKAENIIKELSKKNAAELTANDLIKLTKARELAPHYNPQTPTEPTEATLF